MVIITGKYFPLFDAAGLYANEETSGSLAYDP
jgi:hypothetical protein